MGGAGMEIAKIMGQLADGPSAQCVVRCPTYIQMTKIIRIEFSLDGNDRHSCSVRKMDERFLLWYVGEHSAMAKLHAGTRLFDVRIAAAKLNLGDGSAIKREIQDGQVVARSTLGDVEILSVGPAEDGLYCIATSRIDV